MQIECPKCNSKSIFKADKQFVEYPDDRVVCVGKKRMIISPRYLCCKCNHSFDTKKHGVFYY